MQSSIDSATLTNSRNSADARPNRLPHAATSWLFQLLALVPGTIFMIDMVIKGSAMTERGRQFSLADDVMISMSYARTLAQTGEWVWYPGAALVEGFTNFLWTVYFTVLHLVGLEGSPASLAVSVTGLLIIAFLAVLMGRWSLATLGSGRIAMASALTVTALVPFLYPLTYWTLRGYEVGIIVLLAACAGYSITRILTHKKTETSLRFWRVVTGLAVAAGVLIRMDFVAIAFGITGATLLTQAPLRDRVRTSATTLLSAFAALVAVALFQWLYWGSLVPNTYTLKVEGFTLTERLERGLTTLGLTLPVIVLGMIALIVVFKAAKTPQIRTPALLAGSVLATSAAYNAWTGGDAWEWLLLSNRYLSVALPFALFLIVVATTVVIRSREAPSWPIAVPLVLLAGLSTLGMGLRTNPFAYTTDNIATPALLVTLLLTISLIAVRLRHIAALRGAAVFTALLTSALALVLVSSTNPFLTYWSAQQAQLVGEDLNRIRDGLDLREITTPDARIAVLPAGSLPYYSERETIDLLGKSDAFIASLPPQSLPPDNPMSEFLPGHNKWNYEYSIRELRPDVVYSPNFDFSGFESLEAWGYVPLCTRHNVRSYFLGSSTNIDWVALQPC